GEYRMASFLDEQSMWRLYQNFVFKYYQTESPLLKVHALQIPWVLDDDKEDMLPKMNSDIVLQQGKKVHIIDTKYYSNTTQSNYGKTSIHSEHLYQIFTYVKNMDDDLAQNMKVSGMLLYAKTDEALHPNHTYQMSGNEISVKTLNLNQKFK